MSVVHKQTGKTVAYNRKLAFCGAVSTKAKPLSLRHLWRDVTCPKCRKEGGK